MPSLSELPISTQPFEKIELLVTTTRNGSVYEERYPVSGEVTDGSLMIEGTIPLSLKYEAGDYDDSRTMNAFAVLTVGARPLRILTLGDSVGFTSTAPLLRRMQALCGYAGGKGFLVAGSGATTGENVPLSGGVLNLVRIDAGEYVRYGFNGDGVDVGDTVEVLYRRLPGVGTFKIQSSSDGSTWTDIGPSSVSTANATEDGQTLTISVGAGARLVRALGLSGASDIVQIYHTRATGRGVTEFALEAPGRSFAQFNALATGLRRGYINGAAPDVIFLRWYDSESLESQVQVLLADLAALGRATTTDIVVLGPSPTEIGETDRPEGIDAQRQACIKLGITFIDLYQGFNSRFLDGAIHPTQIGYDWTAFKALHALGWSDIPAVVSSARMAKATPNYIGMTGSYVTPSSLIHWLAPGLYRVQMTGGWRNNGAGGAGYNGRINAAGSALMLSGHFEMRPNGGPALHYSVADANTNNNALPLGVSGQTAYSAGWFSVDVTLRTITPCMVFWEHKYEAPGDTALNLGAVFQVTPLE